MKKHKFLFFAFALPILSFSQKNDYILKLYNNMSYTYNNFPNVQDGTTHFSSLKLLKLLPGFSIKREKNEIDFFINNLSLGSDNLKKKDKIDSVTSHSSETKFRNFNLGFTIFHYWQIKTFKNERLSFQAGFGISPSYGYILINPTQPHSSKTSLNSFYLNLSCVPKINYKLTDKLNFELNIPFVISDIKIIQSRVFNPNFTKDQQISRVSNFEMFPKNYLMNIGVAYKL